MKILKRIFIDGLSGMAIGIICNIDHWNDFRTSRNDHRRRYRKYDRYGLHQLLKY